MSINLSGLLSGLDKALSAVQDMAGIAKELGIVGPVATIAATAATIGRNILDRADEGLIVLKSDDRAKIEAALTDIQAANDRLSEAIRDS